MAVIRHSAIAARRAGAYLGIVAALAAVYFAAGKLGLMLATVHASATAVWPPTGIALAAFLVLGHRVWPGVLLGAFLVNLTTEGTAATSLGIATGNMLEGAIGALLVNRFAGGRFALGRASTIFKFALLAAVLSTMVSATCGVTTLALGGFADWARYRDIWLTWWLGDAAGALTVAPAILAWSASPFLHWSRARAGEAALMLGLVVLVGLIVYWESFPVAYLSIPVLLWPAFRFGQRETATALLVLSGIATWATLHGKGPLVGRTPDESLLLLQAFMGITAVMTLALAAVVSEQKQGQRRLRAAHAELEALVRLRTAELTSANEGLHQALERALQAERLAAIGQMAAGLAHESRNALQQIQASIELLARRVTREPEVRFIAEIQRAEERLLHLFEDVRGYAAPVNLDCRVHNLAMLWRDAWEQTRPHREHRDVQLEERTDGADLECSVDPFCIERVFHNVLLNAVAACREPARIEISASEIDLDGEPAVSVAIRDNGPGLTAEQRRKVFEPFYTTKANGTGLGMAISRRIVEAHGGRITARNGPTQGAEIEVTLPRRTR